MSTTRPGSLLKKQIKVRTFADWDDLQPGFLEADLVAHCGESAAGSFLHTLVLVDVATGWTECVALLRRSEADVIGALNSLRGRLPVPLLGLDTDNGSEFINYEMLRYCQREQITFTRSRVNRKNDQAFVEEKNGSVVRRLIGYDRYEGLGAWRREQLYKAEIARVEPTTSEIGSQSLPVAPPESRETGPAPVALRAPSPRPVVSEARNQ